ncbi:MAG: hypothetical protein ACKVOL_10450 [Novosphingobium sp.]
MRIGPIVHRQATGWLLGSKASDTLDGGAGNDRLIGGIGSDIFYAGPGADHIRFTAIPTKPDYVDNVYWSSGEGDIIEFSRAIFTAFDKSGALDPEAFYKGDGIHTAHNASDRLRYDTASGTLYYPRTKRTRQGTLCRSRTSPRIRGYPILASATS